MRILLVAATAALVITGCSSSASSGHPSVPSRPVAPSTSVPTDSSNPYTRPELPAAAAIPGLIYKAEPNHFHVPGLVSYDTSPPIGGNHSPYWANCTGTVYDHQIANENAVHMLEHGAVWITYNPATLPAGELPTLTRYVAGVDRMALSPYGDLKTPISLQAWGYQLFVTDASDPRIQRFIDTLRYNQQVTPEIGASCSDPYFDPSRSTPGHPQESA